MAQTIKVIRKKQAFILKGSEDFFVEDDDSVSLVNVALFRMEKRTLVWVIGNWRIGADNGFAGGDFAFDESVDVFALLAKDTLASAFGYAKLDVPQGNA